MFWIPVAALGMDSSVAPGIVLLAVGILGPAFSAVLLTCLTCDREERRDYWIRLTDVTRIRPAWYAVVLLLPPAYSALAYLTAWVIGGKALPLDTAVRYFTHPLTIIPLAVLWFFYGPLPEEMGWRGYALDRLQRKWGALTSSLVLGIFWAVWHGPLFFMRGTTMSDVFPLWSAGFWVAMGPGILAGAVIMTWVYNGTGRSTLAAVLLHFMMDFTGEFLRLPGAAKNYTFAWTIILAIALIVVCGPATLAGRKRVRATGAGREAV